MNLKLFARNPDAILVFAPREPLNLAALLSVLINGSQSIYLSIYLLLCFSLFVNE